ncbi:mycothiol synthase [Brachybacterium sp. UMB0905]|uniref:mycothiol synthase n=1 Tax=Brachybacterium sp. UMB0905 TaxID=2069310 RepID=UPI000C80A1CD|nr:mycothiol synthase [Brachybacterium sp. UMB0905]PMC76835.1 mycothiol synthase [Brachybacterium sp. UMB0905]
MIITDALTPARRETVRALAERARLHDGIGPLDEAALLALDDPTVGATHLLVEAGATGTQTGADGTEAADGDDADADLHGYASVLADGTIQGMVDPQHRRRGHGSALLEAALEATASPAVWAHGALAAALALLTSRGLVPTRDLLTMRRPLDAEHPVPAIPAVRDAQVQLGTIDLPRELERWVEVNALAFADHPEQGALTAEDFTRRTAQDWFDAADVHVARREDRMIGFVWIKREQPGQDVDPAQPGDAQPGDAPPLDAQPSDAEVYVVATDPAEQGRGIAGALLTTALHRLQDQGVPAVELYVEADATAAVGLYERWGFTVSGRDVQLRPERV